MVVSIETNNETRKISAIGLHQETRNQESSPSTDASASAFVKGTYIDGEEIEDNMIWNDDDIWFACGLDRSFCDEHYLYTGALWKWFTLL